MVEDPDSGTAGEPEGLSFTDHNGLVARRADAYVRTIPPHRAAFHRALFASGLIDQLCAAGLFVESAIERDEGEGGGLVVAHRAIQPVTYPHEWAAGALADAARLQLDLTMALESHGLTCADAHPLNIVFEGARPCFVDLGSIDIPPAHTDGRHWHRAEQFEAFFLRPLTLMALGHGRLARNLLRDYEVGVDDAVSAALTATAGRGRRPWASRSTADGTRAGAAAIQELVRKARMRLWPSRRRHLDHLRARLDSVDVGAPPALTLGRLPPEQLDQIDRIVAELVPERVLDVGGEWTTSTGTDGVVVATTDEVRLEHLRDAAARRDERVAGVYLDLLSPSHDLANRWWRPAAERLRSNLVIGLGVVEEAAGVRAVRPEFAIDRLAEFTSDRLLLGPVQTDRSWELPELGSLLTARFGTVRRVGPSGSWFLCSV